jgi:hypothetical protein
MCSCRQICSCLIPTVEKHSTKRVAVLKGSDYLLAVGAGVKRKAGKNEALRTRYDAISIRRNIVHSD